MRGGASADERARGRSRETGCRRNCSDLPILGDRTRRSHHWGSSRRGALRHHDTTIVTTSTHTGTSGDLPGLHGRLTVLPSEPRERAALTEQILRLMAPTGGTADNGAPSPPLRPDDYRAARPAAAVRRVEGHERG